MEEASTSNELYESHRASRLDPSDPRSSYCSVRSPHRSSIKEPNKAFYGKWCPLVWRRLQDAMGLSLGQLRWIQQQIVQQADVSLFDPVTPADVEKLSPVVGRVAAGYLLGLTLRARAPSWHFSRLSGPSWHIANPVDYGCGGQGATEDHLVYRWLTAAHFGYHKAGVKSADGGREESDPDDVGGSTSSDGPLTKSRKRRISGSKSPEIATCLDTGTCTNDSDSVTLENVHGPVLKEVITETESIVQPAASSSSSLEVAVHQGESQKSTIKQNRQILSKSMLVRPLHPFIGVQKVKALARAEPSGEPCDLAALESLILGKIKDFRPPLDAERKLTFDLSQVESESSEFVLKMVVKPLNLQTTGRGPTFLRALFEALLDLRRESIFMKNTVHKLSISLAAAHAKSLASTVNYLIDWLMLAKDTPFAVGEWLRLKAGNESSKFLQKILKRIDSSHCLILAFLVLHQCDPSLTLDDIDQFLNQKD